VYEYDSSHVDEGLELMRKLLAYRKQEVDKLLCTVMKKMGTSGN